MIDSVSGFKPNYIYTQKPQKTERTKEEKAEEQAWIDSRMHGVNNYAEEFLYIDKSQEDWIQK